MMRLLFLSASPDDEDRLKVEEEFNKIRAAIRASEYRDQFKLEQMHAVSLNNLHEVLLDFKPNIIHFSGHGSQDGLLMFEDSEGLSEEAPINAFASLFQILNDGKAEEDKIRCLVLNACYSAKKQAVAIARHIDCVIGTSNAIKDSSAISFAESFYRALGYGESVQQAFNLGKNQLKLFDDPDESIISLQSKQGIDPSTIFLIKKSQPDDSDSQSTMAEIRQCGLENLTRDYFIEHKTTKKDIENWKKGFPFKLEAIKEGYELRRKIVSLIDGKMHEQMAVLMLGESGASKSTILMEIICDYFDRGYLILQNLTTADIKNGEQLTRNLKELLKMGKKILVAVDDVHTEKSAAIFFVIDQLSNFDLHDNIRFVLTGRLPDYDLFVKYGLDAVQERSYKDAIKIFRDDQTSKYLLSLFTTEEITQFIEKYLASAPPQGVTRELAEKIYDSTGGSPVLVKFAILGNGLKKAVEDKVEDYLRNPEYMVTTLVLSILNMAGVTVTGELMDRLGLKKYALRLEWATLYFTDSGTWKTIHSRWDIELFKLLYVDEKDDITLEGNIEYLKGAIIRIFAVNDEKLAVSILQTLYNILAANNIIPLNTLHNIVINCLPLNLSPESRATVYGIIMARPFLLFSKDSIAEELTDRATLADPQNPEICYNIALNFSVLGKYDKATIWCGNAIKHDSDNAEVLYTRACLYMLQDKIEQALADLDKAVKIDIKYSALAKQESYFEPVRKDPRFLATIK